MIQLNLLPDVKLAYIKAHRSRRLLTSVSVLVSLAAVVLLGLLFSISGLQHKHLSDLTKDITSQGAKLQSEPDIGKILTVQNQLDSLTALHAAKPAAARLFDYLNSVTPSTISITNFSTDFTQQIMVLTGGADGLASVNKYVDTLKNTTYTSDAGGDSQKAFNNIVLASFGVNGGSQDKSQAATYTINLSYDKNIFDIAQKITLSVPQITTTRADQAQSSDLFKAPAASAKGSQ